MQIPPKKCNTLIYVKADAKNLKKKIIYEHLVKKSCTFAPQKKPILIINDTNSVPIFLLFYINKYWYGNGKIITYSLHFLFSVCLASFV